MRFREHWLLTAPNLANSCVHFHGGCLPLSNASHSKLLVIGGGLASGHSSHLSCCSNEEMYRENDQPFWGEYSNMPNVCILAIQVVAKNGDL